MKFLACLLILISPLAISGVFSPKEEKIFEGLIAENGFSDAVSAYKRYADQFNSKNASDIFPRQALYKGLILNDNSEFDSVEVIANQCGKFWIDKIINVYPNSGGGVFRLQKSESYSHKQTSNRISNATITWNNDGEENKVLTTKIIGGLGSTLDGTLITIYDKMSNETLVKTKYDFDVASDFTFLASIVRAFRDNKKTLKMFTIDLSSPTGYSTESLTIEPFQIEEINLWKVLQISEQPSGEDTHFTIYGIDALKLADLDVSGKIQVLTLLKSADQPNSVLCDTE